MRRYLLLVLALISIQVSAQVPYFGTTEGKDGIYSYNQVRIHPGINNQSFYTAFQYGITDWFDLSMNFNSAGFTNAYGAKFELSDHKNIQVGLMPMVEFNIIDNFKFNGISTGLFLNGNIIDKLGYCSNTWLWTDFKSTSIDQWSYIYYNWIVSPMVGAITQVTNSCRTDLAIGCYFPISRLTFYLWTSQLFENIGDRRLVIGFDYRF